jgi:hypothetical protein
VCCRGANKTGKPCAIKSGIINCHLRSWLLAAEEAATMVLLERRIGLCGDATRAPTQA